MNQVMIVAQDPATRDQLLAVIKDCGVTFQVYETLEPALADIEKEPPVVVLSQDPPDDQTMEQLEKTLQMHAPVTPLLIYLPDRNSELALKRMSQGAYDCLCPPLAPGDFLAAGKRAASRFGRRLMTEKMLEPTPWWRQPMTYVTAGVLIFLSLVSMGLFGLWAPPFQIYQLASDHPVGVATEGDVIWVTDWFQQALTALRVQGDYLSILRSQKMGDNQPVAIALAPNYLYTASADGTLRRHRRDDVFSLVSKIPAPGTAPSGLAWDGASLWSCDAETGKIYQHDARLGVQATYDAPMPKPAGLAWEGKHLWVADGENKVLWRLTRAGDGWKKEGPLSLEVFTHNRKLHLSGFTLWRDKAWFVSEGDGVLVSHRLPKMPKENKAS